jgi:hypothetical protein
LSPKNFSTDMLNGFSLLGVVHQNIEGLRVLLEPGEPQVPASQKHDRAFFEECERRRNAPLRGIEGDAPSREKR